MTEKDFELIQDELDKHYLNYAKKDFLLKVEHHKNIQDLLNTRNTMIKSEEHQKKYPNFFSTVFSKYASSYDIMPVKNEEIDADWIEWIDVRYEDDFEVFVEIELKENEYLKNKKIFKKFNLRTEKSEKSDLEWKNKNDALIFKYFEDDNEEIAVFDILYEAYVNALFYYSLEEECCEEEDSENEGCCDSEEECCGKGNCCEEEENESENGGCCKGCNCD